MNWSNLHVLFGTLLVRLSVTVLLAEPVKCKSIKYEEWPIVANGDILVL